VAAAVAALLALGLLAAPAAGQAAPADPCPAAVPVSQVTAGLTGTGYTVSSGTTPEPFTARVIGVLEDGIAPGLDMSIVETDSPAIRAVGGIWFGMSGSPVYTGDGRGHDGAPRPRPGAVKRGRAHGILLVGGGRAAVRPLRWT
jgi:hypothetical protein